MEKILLSIVIPIYNAEKYLRDCLNSVLDCEENNIEIILIDDGSEDNSFNICKEYQQGDKRVVLLHQKNSGVSKARNYGIDVAKGKYIAFVDSDDLLDTSWSSIIQDIKEDDLYFFSEKLKEIVDKDDMIKYIVGYNKENLCFAGPFSKLIKKDLLDINNIRFNEKLINGEDMLFNLQCLIACKNFKVIQKSYYNYRNFVGSATKKFNKKIFESDLLFQHEITKLYINSDLKEKIQTYNVQMAICVLLQRISFIDSYRKTKDYYRFIHNEPYSIAISKKYLINKKYHFILFLAKLRLFYMVYLLFKTIRLIKNNKENYYFSKI